MIMALYSGGKSGDSCGGRKSKYGGKRKIIYRRSRGSEGKEQRSRRVLKADYNEIEEYEKLIKLE